MSDSKNKEGADTLYNDTFNKYVGQYGDDKARQIAQRAVRDYWMGNSELDEDEHSDF